MLTYQDCIGLCDLTDEEIEAIAMHEHLPQIVAMELGQYLIEGANGVPHIKRIILEDIDEAKRRSDQQLVLRLKLVLKHFVETHPENISA